MSQTEKVRPEACEKKLIQTFSWDPREGGCEEGLPTPLGFGFQLPQLF